jgi:poly(A) polymerase
MTAYPGKLAGAAFLADPGVKRIFALLASAGHEARVVGGVVRNTLMGRGLSRKPVEVQKFDAMAVGAMGAETSDIDICATATPDEIMRIGEAEDVHAVPTGFDHGTVTLVINRVPYEVTTLREDVETDGRRAKVRFGRSFEKDAFRRDFTMNALSCEADGTVHDYATGIEDVAARRVRFIGDADQRIREDFLRILRLFRFAAAYGDGVIDADGLAAAIRHRDGLRLLSRERIGQETMKLIVQPDAVAVVAIMAGHGFLHEVLGGPADVARFARLCAIEAGLGEVADAVQRLAALGVSGAGDAKRLQERLRLSGAQAERLGARGLPLSSTRNSSIAGGWRGSPERSGGRGEGEAGPRASVSAPSSGAPLRSRHLLPQGEKEIAPLRKLLHSLGPDAYRDAIMAAWAADGAGADDPGWREAYELPRLWTPPAFMVSGKDLIAAGMTPGPALGEMLKRIEEAWIAAGMPEGREAQMQILREHL